MNRVCDGQGSPQVAGAECRLAKTPGSSMNRRAIASVASRFVRLKAAFWIVLFAVLVVFNLSAVRLHASESANSFYKHGQNAEASEDYDGAYNNYQKAYAKDPKDLRYRAAYYRIRVVASAQHITKGRKLLQTGNEPTALVEFLRAAEIDPGNEAAQQEIARVRQKHGETASAGDDVLPVDATKQEDLNAMSAPVVLKPVSNEPLTLHMSEDSKVVYQAVGRAAGINVLFDPDYTSKRVQVDLNNVSLVDALRIVGTISSTFWRPVTSNTVFVAANTRAKRTELDEQAVQTFYLTNAWQQNDLNDVQTALRNVLGANVKVYGVPSQNAIVMRGTPDELLLAQKLIDDLDKARPEVVVDIAVLEVSKNWEKNLGITWPTSATIALQTDIDTTSSSSTTTTTSTVDEATLYSLSHLKSSDFLVTIGAAQANMLLSDTNTKILDNPRIRCTDGQKATMKMGKRVPIATGSYSTGTSTTVTSSLVNTQFQYIDVGVNIEMTPTIHYDHDVTLKIKIEDSSEDGSVTISSVTEPIIAQKTSEQTIRLREGEASIMSGMVNKSDTVSWNGIPGLSSIPGLKYLFGSKDHTITEDEIVFLMIPHIVRTQDVGPRNLRTIDTGVGTSIELRYVPTASSDSNPAVVPKPGHQARERSTYGTVTGQSAQAAAPGALVQMLASAEPDSDTAAHTTQPKSQSSTQLIGFSFIQPSAPLTVGSTFKLPVVLNGGADIASVPLRIQYDAQKLSLVNVDNGDLLGKDGQNVALLHRDDPIGSVTINASRPPGAAGINGSGVVCVLSFQAKAAGASNVTITGPGAITSTQKIAPANGAQISLQVR